MSSDFIASVTQKGHPVILAASDYFYLDCGAGEWVGGDPNANSWCDPFKTWQRVYYKSIVSNRAARTGIAILPLSFYFWTVNRANRPR